MKRPGQDDQEADLSALRAFGAAARRHRRLAGAAMLAVAVATVVAYAAAPRRYVARGSVWLDNSFAAAGRAAPANGVLARNTELRVLTSSDIAGQVVDTLGLARTRGVGQPADGSAIGLDEGRRRAVQAVLSGLQTRTSGGSSAVAVSYTSADPVLATGILNQTIDRYVAFRQTGGARARERTLLREETERAHDEAIRAEAAIAALRTATNSAGGEDPRERILSDIADLDTQLGTARGEQTAAEARLAAARSATVAGGSDRARDLASQLAELNVQRADLVRRLGSIHPDVVAVTRRIAEADREFARENGTANTPRLAAEVRAARGRTAMLRAARARADDALQASVRAVQRLGRLEKEGRGARDKYGALLARYRKLTAPQPAGQGGAYVISRATVPDAPDYPRGWRFAGFGLLAALLAGGMVVAAREMLALGFRTRRHFEGKLGVPVVGMVPDLARTARARGAGGEGVDPIDYLFADARSPFNAAFRSIHAGLRLGSGARSPRSVAVSSALPDEGKTTVSICLARSAALAGLRVALIDCDVRLPAASRALFAHVESGLVEVLAGDVTVRQALLRDTPSGAWILAHSTAGEGATELIGSPAMAKLLAGMVHDFDLIVLDTPPALALAEARAVAAMADSVLLVARWRKTPVEATRIALDQLSRAGAKVAGAVLSRVGR